MRMDPKAVGERSEGAIIAAFLKAGMTVLTPFGDNQRYDLVLDYGEGFTFVRVQCKTGRIKDGALLFSTSSSYAHRGGKRKGYAGQIEAFAVYSPELDKVFMVPVEDVGKAEASLRIDPPKNRQKNKIRLAEDFEFKKWKGLIPL